MLDTVGWDADDPSVKPTRTGLVTLAVATLAAAASGCGGSGGSSSSSASSPAVAPPAAQARPAVVRSGSSDGAGLITVSGGIGSLRYSCDRASGSVSATLGGRIEATESVYVEGDGHRHLKAGMMVLGPFAVVGARTGTMLWHVIHSTEPRTLDVRIRLQFPTDRGCSPTRWTATTYVIPHDKPWSPPPGWL